MNNLRKIAAGSLAAVLAFSMAACGSSNASSDGTGESTGKAVTVNEKSAKATSLADFGTMGKLDDRYLVDPTTGLRNPNIVDELSLRAAAGVSIHWRSPMGPIRFDLSKVLSKEDYDKTETFRFSTSTQF